MDKIYIKARAKINLSLDVLNKRDDGYHNIESVFQKINLYDELFIQKIEEDKFILESDIKDVSIEDNIIYKAYNKLKQHYNIGGIKVILNKNIPMQAGLGGGSTDGANFIIAINKLFDLHMSKSQIKSLGSSLGADVVPCMYNKAIIAEGIGDIITPIDTNFKYYIVLIKPKISCNTKNMYQKIDELKAQKSGKNASYNIKSDYSNNIVQGLKQNSVNKIASNLYNIFEEVQDDKASLKDLKQELINNGAINALMTGSGSCIFGLFDSKLHAQKCYNALKEKYNTYICTSYNSKREFI